MRRPGSLSDIWYAWLTQSSSERRGVNRLVERPSRRQRNEMDIISQSSQRRNPGDEIDRMHC